MQDNRLTRPMLKALRKAAARDRGTLCPMYDVHAAAEKALLGALTRRGLIDMNNGIPVINAAGRAAVLEYVAE